MSGRGPRFVPLPDDVIARARAMRSGTVKMPWERIALELGVKVFRLRKSLDPGYTRMGPGGKIPALRKTGVVVMEARPIIPEETEQDRIRLLQYVPENLTALVMGDPPPWRSALAEKHRTQNASRDLASATA